MRKPLVLSSLVALCLLLALPSVGASQQRSMAVPRTKITPDPEQENRLPRELREIGWDQNIGDRINGSLSFTDQNGEAVTLGQYFGDHPVLLAPVYYDCPMLCSLVLDGIVRGLKPLSFESGSDFEIVAVSFDSRETPEMAERARATSLARYGKREGEYAQGWNYLVASGDDADSNIAELMSQIGFNYKWDESTAQYAHAGGVVLLTPEGQISRYFYGVDYAPKDLRLGLIEASENKLGTIVDQVLLFCYQYDPAIGKYSAVALNIIRLGGILTVLLLVAYMGRMFYKDRQRAGTLHLKRSS